MRWSFLIGVASFILFLFFQTQGIYAGDSGDLVTAAYLAGVPHPPGYPFYTLLGWLVSRIPFLTVSWRVTLLSSLPHAATVSLVFLLTHHLTKNAVAALFAATVLAGNYPFFLYSVTPEVFALFDLFVILLFLLLVWWDQTKRPVYLFAASFVFGLSLTHHHVILFLVPALAYFMWTKIKDQKSKIKISTLFLGLVFFLIGLLAYLYLPVASSRDPIINWDRPVNLAGFIRLVTRADYGTFVSSGAYGKSLQERLLAVKAYVQFIVLDLTWIGIILVTLGLFWLWVKQRRLFWMWLLGLFFVGPVFFFYASFPLANRFALGTYERFLLPSYTLLAPLVGWGALAVFWAWEQVAQRLFSLSLQRISIGLLPLVLFLYPLGTGAGTLWRFWGLPADRTAENLGYDMLASAPQSAIVLLAQDTPLFTTQYVRYVAGVRPDTIVLHTARLPSSDYQRVVAKNFPQLTLPEVSPERFITEFLTANVSEFPIVANIILPTDKNWYWVPQGLLYRLVPQDALPPAETMRQENLSLWAKFHDLTRGILSRYPHLMLSDVRDVYASSRLALGRTLMRAGRFQEAKEQFTAAVSFDGDITLIEAYTLLGVANMSLKDCAAALAAFEAARGRVPFADPKLLLYQLTTYRECGGDAARAQQLFSEYEKLRREMELPLEKL